MKTTLGLIFLLFATLFSCMRQEKPLPAELSRAESVMWEHSDLLDISSSDEWVQNTMDYFEKGGNHAKKLAEVQAKYDHERLLNINNQLKIEKTNQQIIGLFVISVLLVLVIVYQYRVLRKEKSLVYARKEIRIYKESIRENENRIRENGQLIAILNNKQLENDEILSENKILLEQNEKYHQEIEKYEELLKSSYKKLDEQLPYFDKLKDLKEYPRYLKDADWSLIINWTNLQYHQFYTRLGKDFPDFSELDKRYCCLIKMGFTSSQIAVFANSLPESVSKQKQRIKQRIKKSKQMPVDVNFLLDQYLKEY
ncbi:hypothetical protein [uncultured Parabacteroides sp.]|uniref:hypothetical protein n=1 Tax=uncultured Parabacteroides sp. TaxID=512312 RepID=UPI00260CC074|nr:hypothetical protein [uncultured Parabacteroides sp.]